MKSMCKIEHGKPICKAKERLSQKYCKHCCRDLVHIFCAYGLPGGECKEPDAVKESKTVL